MARVIIEKLTDDIDGSEDDVKTIRFTYGGQTFEIDLGPKNRKKFDEAIALFIGHSRRPDRFTQDLAIPRQAARAARRAGADKATSDFTYARRWHVAEGLPVSDRGRLRPEQMDAWAAAGSPKLDA